MSLHNLDILNAAVGLLSFLIFFIHWMSNRKPSLPNFLFRCFLIANAYYFFVAALIKNDGILSLPHLFRTGTLAGLLAAPFVYLILVKSLKNEPWKNIDYLHFVPAVLYVIDFFPFFILPMVSKLKVLENLSKSGDTATLSFDESWIFSGILWILIKVLQPLAYSIICFITLDRIIKKSGRSFKNDNRRLILLLYWLSAYLFLNTIPIGLSFAGLTGSNGWEITSFIIFSSTLITCLFLLFNPEVLYGLKGIWITTPINDPIATLEGTRQIGLEDVIEKPDVHLENGSIPNESDIRETYLSVRQVENMKKVLGVYMNENQPYLQQGFSLPQLAKETKFQLQHVSAFLNQHVGENFNDYINKFRVNHLINLFKQDPTIIDQFTLEYLGNQSGFGSRSAFISSFKKNTGQTPSAYFKS
jgi:AraC-like DNA-binding protein